MSVGMRKAGFEELEERGEEGEEGEEGEAREGDAEFAEEGERGGEAEGEFDLLPPPSRTSPRTVPPPDSFLECEVRRFFDEEEEGLLAFVIDDEEKESGEEGEADGVEEEVGGDFFVTWASELTRQKK